jgi:serine/threonine protein kinase/tetratricopeptide (TPR) repeat protein
MSTAPETLVPPAAPRIGEYVVLRTLGRGGQGTVYLAEDPRLGRKVALKVLEGFDAGAGEAVERLRREAVAVSALRHPGICAVYEARVDARPPYLAMQYVEGETLAAHIAATRGRLSGSSFGTRSTIVEQVDLTTNAAPPPEPAAAPTAAAPPRLSAAEVDAYVRIAEGAARALHAAHEAGIVHRDVKPGNVMIAADGAPVLLDFGLARREEADAVSLTHAGELCGTPAYMSPEQLGRGAVRVDARTDIWSLGATLYECLALRRPFEAPTREGLYREILVRDPDSLRRACPAAPRELEAVVLTALAKERDRRYQTALDFAEDLRRVRSHEPVRARRAGPLRRLALFARREPARAALFATILVALPTVAALWTSVVKDRPAAEASRRAAAEEERQATLADASYEISEGHAAKGRELFAAVAAAGDSPEAAAGLVMAELELGRADEAAAALAAARPLLRGGAVAAFLEADIARARGDAAAAKAAEASAPPPTAAFDHALLAQRALLRGEARRRTGRSGDAEFALAVDHATRALLLAPRPRLDLLVLRAHAAGHLGDEEAASSSARALRRHWPRRRVSTYWAAFALLGAQEAATRPVSDARLDESLEAAREAVELAPGDVSAQVNLGAALEARGLYEASLALYREAAVADPLDDRVRHNLSIALSKLGRHDEAIAEMREAARLDPKGVSSIDQLGRFLEAAGRREEAAEAFAEGVRRAPGSFWLQFAFGSACYGLGRTDDALVALREAVRLAPEDKAGVAWNRLGLALENARRFAEALDAYRRGDELSPPRDDGTDPSAERIARAEAAAAKQAAEIAEAAKFFEAGEPPDEPSDQVRSARALLDADRPADAALWFTEAFDAEPALADDTRARLLPTAARAYALSGDPARALAKLSADVEALRRALQSGSAKPEVVVFMLRKIRHTQAFAPYFADPPPDAAEPWRAAAAAHLAAHRALDAEARARLKP